MYSEQPSDVPEKSMRRFAEGPLLAALAAAMLVGLDPLGIEEATAERSVQTVMRLSSVLYGNIRSNASDVTVVLLDETYVKATGDVWPVMYRKQGYLLNLIETYNPSAVFVDLLYTNPHAGDDPAEGLLSAINSETKTRFYLAGLANQPARANCTGGVSIGSSLEVDRHRLLEPIRNDPLIQGDGRLALVDWRGCEERYPMFLGGDPDVPSPAFALYRDVALHAKDGADCFCYTSWHEAFVDPMHLRWGAFAPPTPQAFIPEGQQDVCQRDLTASLPMPVRRMWVLAREFFFATFHTPYDATFERFPCPAVNVISAATLLSVDPDNEHFRNVTRSLLTDHFVFVGASIPGSADFRTSEMHGRIPGVMLHAVALDNLLRYGTGYLREMSVITMHWVFTPLVLVTLALIWYWLPVHSWRRGLERTGIVFLVAVAVVSPFYGLSERALMAIVGGAILFVIAPTAAARALFSFFFVCLAAIVSIELGQAPMNTLIVTIAAVLVNERIYDETHSGPERAIVQGRIAFLSGGIRRAFAPLKRNRHQSTGEHS